MNLSKLVSRKLIVTISTVAGLIASKAYAEAAGVAAAYVVAQGYVDSKTAKEVVEVIDDVVDVGKVTVPAEHQAVVTGIDEVVDRVLADLERIKAEEAAARYAEANRLLEAALKVPQVIVPMSDSSDHPANRGGATLAR